MDDLRKIGDVASSYGITGRTLRYYEEIGLLKSVRAEDSRYRLYDGEALECLEEILILRRLDISMSEIFDVMSSRNPSRLVEALSKKLALLKKENRKIEGLRALIERFLASRGSETKNFERLLVLLRNHVETPVVQGGLEEKEETAMIDEKKELTDEEVRIVKLLPAKVAWYRAESETPETDAWKVMLEWIKSKEFEKLPATRYFGFNNPDPTDGTSVYGYEVWVTVPDGTEPDETVGVKEFEGGLYAVIPTFLYDIGRRWSQLVGWVEKSGHETGKAPCLEEHIFIDETRGTEKMQLDLYQPLER